MKKLLPTSTAGSLPKPSWLAEPEKLWSPWRLEGEDLVEGKKDALRLSLQEQLHAGIDLISDGEQTRQQQAALHLGARHLQLVHLAAVPAARRMRNRSEDRSEAEARSDQEGNVPTDSGVVKAP